MVTLKQCLGEDRWAQVQQSSLSDQINGNVLIEGVTMGEIVGLAILFDTTVQQVFEELYAGFILEEGE